MRFTALVLVLLSLLAGSFCSAATQQDTTDGKTRQAKDGSTKIDDPMYIKFMQIDHGSYVKVEGVVGPIQASPSSYSRNTFFLKARSPHTACDIRYVQYIGVHYMVNRKHLLGATADLLTRSLAPSSVLLSSTVFMSPVADWFAAFLLSFILASLGVREELRSICPDKEGAVHCNESCVYQAWPALVHAVRWHTQC